MELPPRAKKPMSTGTSSRPSASRHSVTRACSVPVLAARPVTAVTAGAGSSRRWTLPLWVRGKDSMRTKEAGTMCWGSRADSCRLSSASAGISPPEGATR